MFRRLTISKNVNNNYKLCYLPIRLKSYTKLKSFKDNDSKLLNNVIRAKSKVLDYALNNKFQYFVTLTFNRDFDNCDLDNLRRKVSQLIREWRRIHKSELRYILIPEKHKSGLWHLHGFFDANLVIDLYYNKFNYLTWRSFEKFGFCSVQNIRDYNACCYYITKYITKDLANLDKGKHLYFCSRGLNSSEKVGDFVTTNIEYDFQFVSDYCSLSRVDRLELYNFLKQYKHKFVNYYN